MKTLKIGLLVGVAVLFGTAQVSAQERGFGKNKINYDRCTERVLPGTYVDVNYCEEAEEWARAVLQFAEEAKVEFEGKLKIQAHDRIQMHLYSNEHDWHETSIWKYGILPIGIWGFVEGEHYTLAELCGVSLALCYETTRHELWHEFQRMIIQQEYGVFRAGAFGAIPAWFAEGQAKYMTSSRSPDERAVIQEIVDGGFLAFLNQMFEGGYQPYILGSEALRFLSGDYPDSTMMALRENNNGLMRKIRFGDDSQFKIYRNIPGNGFTKAFEITYGVTMDEFLEIFFEYLRLTYGDRAQDRFGPPMFADQFPNSSGNRKHNESVKVLSRCLVPELYKWQGRTYAVCLAVVDGRPGIYNTLVPQSSSDTADSVSTDDLVTWDGVLVNDSTSVSDSIAISDSTAPDSKQSRAVYPKTGRVVTYTATSRYQMPTFEVSPINIVDRFDVYTSENQVLLVFTVTNSDFGDDAIVVFDLLTGREVSYVRFPNENLRDLGSPSWAPDGERIVFRGVLDSGQSDLYVWNRETKVLRRLTNDIYFEDALDWSPVSEEIVFSSDRGICGDYHESSSLNLFRINAETGLIDYVTNGCSKDWNARWSPDGEKILFNSDRSGFRDLYVVDREGSGKRITNITTGIPYAVWFPDSSKVLFQASFRLEFPLYSMIVDTSRFTDSSDRIVFSGQREWSPTWTLTELTGMYARRAPALKYKPRYHVCSGDLQAGGSSFSSGIMWQLGYCDERNEHSVNIGFQSLKMSGSGYTAFQEAFGDYERMVAYTSYCDFSKRLQWCGGPFRFAAPYVANQRTVVREDRWGVFLGTGYPLSRIKRIELGLEIARSTEERLRDFTYYDLDFEFPDSIQYDRVAWIVGANAAYVKDNSLWVYTGPIDGERYRFSASSDLDVAHMRPDNWTVIADYRRYFRIVDEVAVAVRGYGYYGGGYTPRYEGFGWRNHMNLYPDVSPIPFSRASGMFASKIWIANVELRFPLPIAMKLGPIVLSEIQGEIFADAGQVGYDNLDSNTVYYDFGVAVSIPLIVTNIRINWGCRGAMGEDNVLPEGFTGCNKTMVTLKHNF